MWASAGMYRSVDVCGCGCGWVRVGLGVNGSVWVCVGLIFRITTGDLSPNMSGYVWDVHRCALVFEGVYGCVHMVVFAGCAQGCALAVVPCHKIIVA